MTTLPMAAAESRKRAKILAGMRGVLESLARVRFGVGRFNGTGWRL